MKPAVLCVGNCQAGEIARCLQAMVPDLAIRFVRFGRADNLQQDLAKLGGGEVVLLVQHPMTRFGDEIAALRETYRVIDFPAIAYSGFHPDVIRPKIAGQPMLGTLGSNHSAIAIRAYLAGLDESATAALFRGEVFQAIGYYDYKPVADRSFRRQLRKFDLPDAGELEALEALGCFMHITIHPKLPVIARLARLLADRIGLEISDRFPEHSIGDRYAANVVWPVYPEIGAHLGVRDVGYKFQRKDAPGDIYDLEAFIASDFKAYRQLDFDHTIDPRLSDSTFRRIEPFLVRRSRARSSSAATNPYRDLPDRNFWRRAVANVPSTMLDPVTTPKLRLDADTRIATAGSCFAQHIARRLAATGHRYLVAEPTEGLSEAERTERNFGVFSARYGNIYTARQLVQLFYRAFGTFTPNDEAWQREDGRWIDPFRPEIEPRGFDSAEAVVSARAEHLGQVRELLETLDLFVFTLGLTEAWCARGDGAVFPLCPMVTAPALPAEEYAFVNFGHDAIVEDLRTFLTLLRGVNPGAGLLLTVSPVPLIATFEPRHVMVSTVASKSVLRAAADTVSRGDGGIDYFPSYEIVANPFSANCYFEADMRSVAPAGVDHVMRVFLAHYSTIAQNSPSAKSAAPLEGLEAELAEARSVVCEEELLDG